MTLPLLPFFSGYYSIPKIGNLKNFDNFNLKKNTQIVNFKEKIILKINKATRSLGQSEHGASYPNWTIPKNLKELIFLIPVRMFYLLYAPFPWDIKKVEHIIGLLDAFLYFCLSYYIYLNKKNLFNNPQTFFLILIFLLYILVYSFGVGNFGTGLRHRLKFISLAIVLAGSKLPRFKFF